MKLDMANVRVPTCLVHDARNRMGLPLDTPDAAVVREAVRRAGRAALPPPVAIVPDGGYPPPEVS